MELLEDDFVCDLYVPVPIKELRPQSYSKCHIYHLHPLETIETRGENTYNSSINPKWIIYIIFHCSTLSGCYDYIYVD